MLYSLGKQYRQSIEPLINLEIGPQGEEFKFLVDTRADRSCVSRLPKGCKLSKTKNCKVRGAKGKPFEASVIEDVMVRGNCREGCSDLLYVPKLECNLLGRDLQIQLGVGGIPQDGRMVAKVTILRESDESERDSDVWAEEGKSGLLDITPIKTEIEQGTPRVRVRQYPMSAEGRRGLTPVERALIETGILEPCISSHNTPILPVKKPDGTDRLIQDVRGE